VQLLDVTTPMRASTMTATGTSKAMPKTEEQREHEAEVLLDVRRGGDRGRREGLDEPDIAGDDEEVAEGDADEEEDRCS
jgi:hypothetical protein